MKKARFTTELVRRILQEHAAGAEPADVIRYPSISNATLFSGAPPDETPTSLEEAARRPASQRRDKSRALEDESRHLKRLVTDQALNLHLLKDVLAMECQPLPSAEWGAHTALRALRRQRAIRVPSPGLRAEAVEVYVT